MSTAALEKPILHEFSIELDDAKIDSKTSTIRQVSLISLGEAKGHETPNGKQIWVDGKTLSQVFDCLTRMGSLKLKADHGTGVFSIVGWVDGFEKNGSQVLGDMHLYDAEPEKERLFEIAKKNPTHLGLSLEFSGDDEELGDKAYARCDEAFAVALVPEAAANKSLFEKSKKIVDSRKKSGNNKPMAKKNFEEKQEEMGDPIEEMGKRFEEFCNKYNADKEELNSRLKKFDEAISGEGRNIDPNIKTEVKSDDTSVKDDQKTFEADEDKKDDDKKDDKVNKTDLEAAINLAVKKFAASIGATQLQKSGAAESQATGKKNFEELVAIRTKELKGDKTKAMGECLKEFKTEYAEYRKKFLKVEPKTTNYL